MTNNLNNNINSSANAEVVTDVHSFISQFFMFLQRETGLTKKAFTHLGLQNYLKNIAKNCFQLQIYEDLLHSVIKMALSLAGFVRDGIEDVVVPFVMILHRITNFLIKHFLGRGLLMITSTMSAGMAAFVICLFHAITFAIETFSFTGFMMVKDWIVTLCRSEKVKRFFEAIFPSYGRALTVA